MRWTTVALALMLSGCGTLPDQRGWGEDATLEPNAERVRWGARRALQDPGTWIPAVAAGLVYLSGADERLSEWARDKKPVFGNSDPERAGNASDRLRDLTDLGLFATALATPSGPPDEFWENKGRGVAVEALAVLTTITTTNILKHTVRRPQPEGDGHESFVSNHATEPFAHAALIRRNTDHLGLTPLQEGAVDTAFYGMAMGSAWARVEMGLHYPSDQLAGAAIGNFIAIFFHDTFLGLDSPVTATTSVGSTPTVNLGFRW